MKKIMMGTLLGMVSSLSFAQHYNTVGYVTLKEIKNWSNVYDVHLSDNQKHQCSGSHSTRFWVEKDKEQFVSSIMMALTARQSVNLNYYCNAQGYPVVSGIRIRP